MKTGMVDYISICLGLKRKPNRKERKIWVNAINYLYNYKTMDLLIRLMNNNLDYFKIAFREVHEYKNKIKGAYRLFKKLNKSSKVKDTNKKILCEDKLIRSFFKMYRNNPTELVEYFLETDIKLRNLLKLQLIINCKLYNNKTTEDNLDIIREIVDYKLSLKLSEFRSKDNIEIPVSNSLENIYPISVAGGNLNAIYFYKLTPNHKFIDIVDVNTCGICINILHGTCSANSEVTLYNGLGFKVWKRVNKDIKKDIILPYDGIQHAISVISINNVSISNIKFTLFTELHSKNTCGSLCINSKMIESLNKGSVVIVINKVKKEIAIIPDNIITSIRADSLVRIFKLRNHPELSALGILKSIHGDNLKIQDTSPIYDYSVLKSILKG